MLCYPKYKLVPVIDENDAEILSLISVGCIFDHTNVFVNIQDRYNPEEIDWNLNNTSNWKPFLKEKVLKDFRVYFIYIIQSFFFYP